MDYSLGPRGPLCEAICAYFSSPHYFKENHTKGKDIYLKGVISLIE